MEKAENEGAQGRDQTSTDIRLGFVVTTTIKANDEDTHGHDYEPPLANHDDTQIPNSVPSRPSRTHNIPRSLQTVTPSGQPQDNIAPPLLPAFLITGILLGAVVFIIVWRHFVERRRSVLRSVNAGEDDDVWGGGNGASERERFGERPKMWEAYVPEEGSVLVMKKKWKGWENVMPLSATPIFAAPKPQQPRYLIPSDHPTTFMTRMFGGGLEGYRLRPRPPRNVHGHGAGPEISNVAYTNRQWGVHVGPRDYDSGKGVSTAEEDVIESVRLSFVIAMPSERRSDAGGGMAGEWMSGGSSVGATLRRRNSKEGEEMEGRGEKGFLKSPDLRIQSSGGLSEIHGVLEDTFPELCLGSLMIPYG